LGQGATRGQGSGECVWAAVREDSKARAQVCRPRGAGGACGRYCAAQGVPCSCGLWTGGVARESPLQPLRRCVPCLCRVAALRSPVPLARHEQGPLCLCVCQCVPHSPAHAVGVQLVRPADTGAWCERGSPPRALRRRRSLCRLRRAVCMCVIAGLSVSGARRALDAGWCTAPKVKFAGGRVRPVSLGEIRMKRCCPGGHRSQERRPRPGVGARYIS
jgi:hypothetical protein